MTTGGNSHCGDSCSTTHPTSSREQLVPSQASAAHRLRVQLFWLAVEEEAGQTAI